MLKVGDKVPDVSLPDSSGNIVSLKDFKGKKVVLFFYPEDDTPTCTNEACSFRDNIGRLRSKEVEVIGVSPDSVKSHQKFSHKYELPYTLLSDEEKNLIKAFGVWKKKLLFGRRYMGVARTTFIIDERGTIAHIFENVRVKNHIQNIMEKL
ncbi:MAG: thioredoxin-dependent thiol peroxidase [Bacteroidetes bacterium]|nr:MAG: thioredoxin-dependent thiol peroxidase [Bacteroidota bacterium]